MPVSKFAYRHFLLFSEIYGQASESNLIYNMDYLDKCVRS